MSFPVSILSSTPGRLRIRVPGLYRAPLVKRQVEESIAVLEGVESVVGNELTGRALVRYRPDITLDALLAALAPVLTRYRRCPPATEAKARDEQDRPASPGRTARPGSATAQQTSANWYAEPPERVVELLRADPEHGLDSGEVGRRLSKYGSNSLAAAKQRSSLAIFLHQFNSLPVAMLGISAGIAVATGGLVDAAVILGVVSINAAIGYFTEEKAERTIAALTHSGPALSEVVRDGQLVRVPVADLVPGDSLRLLPGSYVPADARLLSSRRLTVDESTLTGESMPVAKKAHALLPVDTMLGDRCNMAYMGTLVTGGDARALVVGTATSTELGRIQSLVESTRPPDTPMEQQLGQLGTQLGVLSALVCGGVFLLGLVRGHPWLQMLTSAMSLAVAAVPEGLPAVATSTLALGIREMERHHVAVRKLDAVEALGALEVLCLDKTGTLTANHMTVVAAYCSGRELQVRDGRFRDPVQGRNVPLSHELSRLLEIVSLCNEVELEGEGRAATCGSPTEVALVELATANGIAVSELQRRYPRLRIKERSEGRPWMTTLHDIGEGRRLIAVKGSPSATLKRATHLLVDGRIEAMDEPNRDRILAANERMAANALRVLAVAYREAEAGQKTKSRDLIWVGLIGMQDPLRPDVASLMQQYHRAGIKTLMITGDQSSTAYAIGKELGLQQNGSLEILDSAHLERMDPELLSGLVHRVDVFSRVSPSHKLRIVQALQRAGKVVAMTGDGINDGPALKAADIGIAMGGSGSDVARSVSDVVIEDDNLHTMVAAVRHGRTIYANIRKSVHYLLSTNFSEIEVMFAGIALGLGQVLNPMQLLWINLVTDIFPALALSMDPPEEGLMEQPPRPAGEDIISRDKLGFMALESAVISAGALAAYLYGLGRGGSALASSLSFHGLTLAQLLHATACRSDSHGLFDPGRQRARNRWLDMALGGTAALHALTMLSPGMRRLLGTTPLRGPDVLAVIAAAGFPLLVNEGIKAARHRVSRPEEIQP